MVNATDAALINTLRSVRCMEPGFVKSKHCMKFSLLMVAIFKRR